jgi:hypothetical protein
MKIGDEVEVLYSGEWIAGKIQGQQNAESNLKNAPARLFTVLTEKGMVMGVAVEHGNVRALQRPATPGQGETAERS